MRNTASAEQVAAAASAAEQAVLDRVRIEQLEASLQRLRSETEQARRSMGGLQARIASAEADRYANPLVYALLLLCGGLLLALGWLWRQRGQDRSAAAWAQGAGSASGMPLAAQPLEQGDEDGGEPSAVPVVGDEPQPVEAAASSMLALEPGEPARRTVSAEELIDLEQQAEFFIVLGQDEAAIDLLKGHLRSTAGTSPLPYLKLLELYRKRGNRAEYERVRESFNSRFSAVAPAWEQDLNAGRTLEDYPSVIGRLQALWPNPSRALEVLQLTLARPAGDPHTRDSFELPAYRELMLLYSVARERVEAAPGQDGVDLLLPLDESEPPMSPEREPSMVERLSATSMVAAEPGPSGTTVDQVEVDTGGQAGRR